MNNKKTLLIITLAFVLLLVSAYALYNRLGQTIESDQLLAHESPSPTAEAPQSASATEQEHPSGETYVPVLAPDFTVYDKDGNAVTLSQFFGKPIVINFWASWCGPCQMEMPDFQEKYNELGNDIHFLMVNMTDGGRETVKTASDFIEQNGYRFPVFYDTTFEAAMTYGAYSLPTTFFINAEGHVITQAMGAIDKETLQQGINMIFA